MKQKFSLTNESLSLYHKKLWSKCKTWWGTGRISAFWISNGSLRIKLYNESVSIITHDCDLEMLFHGNTLIEDKIKLKCIWNKYTNQKTECYGTFKAIFHHKQIFHAFLFNIRNNSPEVINIQLREEEGNLPRVNNFAIKQKRRGISYYVAPTLNKISEDKG